MTSTLLAIARNRKRVDTMLLEPYYAKAVERRFAPRARLKRLQRAYVDWDRLLDSLSRGMLDILQRLRAGTFDAHLEHRKLDTIVNRLVYVLMTAELLLASSQHLSRQIPPLVGGVSSSVRLPRSELSCSDCVSYAPSTSLEV